MKKNINIVDQARLCTNCFYDSVIAKYDPERAPVDLN